MDLREINEIGTFVPSQEWLTEVMDWLEHNPSEEKNDSIISGDRPVIDLLLQSRGARQRVDRIRKFAHLNCSKLSDITCMIGLDPHSEVRKSINKLIACSDDNIATWLITRDRIGKSSLIETQHIQAGEDWLSRNLDHPLAPPLIKALLYIAATERTRSLAHIWMASSRSFKESSIAMFELAHIKPPTNRDILALEKFVLAHLPEYSAQNILTVMLKRNLLTNRQKFLIPWWNLPAEQRNYKVIGELLKITPTRKSVINLAKNAIENEWMGSDYIVDSILKTTDRTPSRF